MAGMVAILCVFGVPIIAILTRHQQKMAAIFQQNQGLANQQENPQVAQELAELRGLINQQAISIDNLVASQRQLAAKLDVPSADISQRLAEHP